MRDIDRRREMRAIRPRVTSGDLAGIAEQIRSMKRLWDPVVLPGLHSRRDKEADLVASADRHYDPAELVSL
jgi:GH24 family phage-related lysozyme (muramidase)